MDYLRDFQFFSLVLESSHVSLREGRGALAVYSRVFVQSVIRVLSPRSAAHTTTAVFTLAAKHLSRSRPRECTQCVFASGCYCQQSAWSCRKLKYGNLRSTQRGNGSFSGQSTPLSMSICTTSISLVSLAVGLRRYLRTSSPQQQLIAVLNTG